MAKKRSVSSVPEQPHIASAEHILNSDIDFSDIPDSTPAELKSAVRVGRPTTGNAKKLVAVRVAPRLLERIRELAAKRETPYQTLMHELLEEGVLREARRLG